VTVVIVTRRLRLAMKTTQASRLRRDGGGDCNTIATMGREALSEAHDFGRIFVRD